MQLHQIQTGWNEQWYAQDVMDKVFLEAQSFTVKDNIMYQDNKSSLKLEKNRRGSSVKKI
eukprot:13268140-Ditylum_brightwellii.AAC.1